MAIVKLVCQGCGANLDALDNQRTFQCGYCGTSNQISKTVHERPAAPAQAPQHSSPYQHPIAQPQPRRGGVGVFVVFMALLPLVIGGIIAFAVFRTTSEVIDSVNAGFGGSSSTPGADGGKYQWNSSRPFIADVNGDGTDDILGLVQGRSSQNLVLTAMSGADWSTLWELDLGNRSEMPGQPKLRYEPQNQLLSFAIGTTLTAYDAKTGAERWVSNFSDGIDRVMLDGDHLWVGTIDKQGSEVSLADGKVSAGQAEPAETAVLLRDDEGYDLIPKLRSMDLDAKVFSELRIQQGFCPDHEVSEVGRHRSYRCAHPRGLVFATRATGTQVPFLVGYDPEAKTESWRVQLTKPGTLETVGSGFEQPRAELFGDAAVVSFVPKDKNPRLRRISLIDGSTTWEKQLPENRTANVEGIVIAGDRVFVTYGNSVRVFAFADGEEQATLGGW